MSHTVFSEKVRRSIVGSNIVGSNVFRNFSSFRVVRFDPEEKTGAEESDWNTPTPGGCPGISVESDSYVSESCDRFCCRR